MQQQLLNAATNAALSTSCKSVQHAVHCSSATTAGFWKPPNDAVCNQLLWPKASAAATAAAATELCFQRDGLNLAVNGQSIRVQQQGVMSSQSLDQPLIDGRSFHTNQAPLLNGGTNLGQEVSRVL